MGLLGLIKYLELIAAITATYHYKKYRHTYLKYFLLILWLVAGVEWTMSLMKLMEVRFQNKFVYNALTTLQYLYYLTLYYRFLGNKSYKKIVLFLIGMYILITGASFAFLQPLTLTALFNSYSFIAGAIFLIIAIGIFFAEILRTEKVLYFKKYLMFWVSIGLILFYAPVIPFVVSINVVSALVVSDILLIVLFALNVITYSCFIVGFIVSKKL